MLLRGGDGLVAIVCGREGARWWLVLLLLLLRGAGACDG
jgi:hypothetical protein